MRTSKAIVRAWEEESWELAGSSLPGTGMIVLRSAATSYERPFGAEDARSFLSHPDTTNSHRSPTYILLVYSVYTY